MVERKRGREGNERKYGGKGEGEEKEGKGDKDKENRSEK